MIHTKRRRGATAIEYGLIAAGIIVAAIVAISLTGTRIEGVFGRISGAIAAKPTNGGSPIPGTQSVYPSWITTACTLPTISQIKNTNNISVTNSTQDGCIPSGSQLKTKTGGPYGSTGLYVKAPGDSQYTLFAAIDEYNTYVSVNTIGGNFGGNSCYSSFYGQVDAANSSSSFDSKTGICTRSGISNNGTPALVALGQYYGIPFQVQ